MEESTQAQQTPIQSFEPLPNATAALVLGILSIVGCCCYAIPGLIMGIIGLVLANKAIAIYDPGQYSEGSFKNAKAGKVTATIGLILSAIFVLFWIAYVVLLFAAPQLIQEIQTYQNRY